MCFQDVNNINRGLLGLCAQRGDNILSVLFTSCWKKSLDPCWRYKSTLSDKFCGNFLGKVPQSIYISLKTTQTTFHFFSCCLTKLFTLRWKEDNKGCWIFPKNRNMKTVQCTPTAWFYHHHVFRNINTFARLTYLFKISQTFPYCLSFPDRPSSDEISTDADLEAESSCSKRGSNLAPLLASWHLAEWGMSEQPAAFHSLCWLQGMLAGWLVSSLYGGFRALLFHSPGDFMLHWSPGRQRLLCPWPTKCVGDHLCPSDSLCLSLLAASLTHSFVRVLNLHSF